MSEDFRRTNIIPTSNELLSNIAPPLRPNIVRGKYEDVPTYLAIQFDLLREDFFRGIREDLSIFTTTHGYTPRSLKLHKVRFLRKAILQSKKCMTIEFISSDNTMWNSEKRFMKGSLVLFSVNNFKSIFYGRVEYSGEIRYRRLLISLSEEENIVIGVEYQMFECLEFFEPYFNVLKVLQTMPVDAFPMKDYIIDITKDNRKPKYLSGCRQAIETSGLNKSQSEALTLALTGEFTIIQGPPGTGKTFLGIEIAKRLLESYKTWWNNSPMVIISYTNHALDQFLEGLLGTTEDILRLGGQSKSLKLKKYTLGPKRRQYDISLELKHTIGRHYRLMRTAEKQLMDIGRYLDIAKSCKPTMIFEFHLLAPHNETMDDWFKDKSNSKEFIAWMLEDDGSLYKNQDGSPQKKKSDIGSVRKLVDCIMMLPKKLSKYCMISTAMLEYSSEQMNAVIVELSKDPQRSTAVTTKLDDLQEMLPILLDKIEHLRFCFRQNISPCNPKLYPIDQPFDIPVKLRWKFYKYWVQNYATYLTTKLDELIEEYSSAYADYHSVSDENTLDLMKSMKVIGLTTTYASAIQESIEKWVSPIVIVEEAAQILECHVVSSLGSKTQQLILIGDHIQLRPATNDFTVEVKYKLGISLFERMVLNNLHCSTLTVQHRMRPEISSLITPAIYDELYNHSSVTEYPDVKGMAKNVFFLNHTRSESAADNLSRKNVHEAQFLVQLAIYLMMVGYSASDITILGAYLGQVKLISKERDSAYYKGVHEVAVKSVDDFQGEENRIILLSLVRSNENEKIGFLNTRNRICVALSRAREGLYIMGNMTILASKNEIWKSVRETLESQNSFGQILPLQCPRHGVLCQASSFNDFQKLFHGSCKRHVPDNYGNDICIGCYK